MLLSADDFHAPAFNAAPTYICTIDDTKLAFCAATSLVARQLPHHHTCPRFHARDDNARHFSGYSAVPTPHVIIYAGLSFLRLDDVSSGHAAAARFNLFLMPLSAGRCPRHRPPTTPRASSFDAHFDANARRHEQPSSLSSHCSSAPGRRASAKMISPRHYALLSH